MIIAIDFDGTIVEHKFPEIGKPIPGAFEVMKKLQQNGHKLILWTCRNDHDPSLDGRKVLDEAIQFLESYGMDFDAINCNVGSIDFNPEPKVYADIYVDDSNFPKCDPADLWEMLEKSSLCF